MYNIYYPKCYNRDNCKSRPINKQDPPMGDIVSFKSTWGPEMYVSSHRGRRFNIDCFYRSL